MPSPPKKLCSRLYRCMEPPSPLAAPSTFPKSSAITSFTCMDTLALGAPLCANGAVHLQILIDTALIANTIPYSHLRSVSHS